MKRIYCFLITISLLISILSSLQAQDTKGTDFWVTFGKSIASMPHEFMIRIVSDNVSTTGIIYFTNLKTFVPFSLAPYGIYTHVLTEDQKQAVYNNTMVTSITNYSLRVTSEYPIAVYVFNHSLGSMDATNVLPVEVLDKEYFQISYLNDEVSNNADAYAVVAIQNNTHLYHNKIWEAMLDSGQVYYRVGALSPLEDMIGHHITTTHPVAFYSLTQLAKVPYGILGSVNVSHLMQQLPPIRTWGRFFFVPVTISGIDIVRVVVTQNNTNIEQSGGIIRTGVPGAQTKLTNLQAGQFVELEVSGNGCFIKATKPVGVCSFLTSLNLSSQPPAQCWISAIEQTTDYALMSPFVPQGFTFLNSHYALVCAPIDAKNNTMVSIGGTVPTSLSGGIWKDNIAAGMSFYNMPLFNSTASYVFTNPDGLIVLGYGNGPNVSYYYLASSAMRNLSAAFTANGIPYDELSEHLFCEHDITFIANIEGIHPSAGSLKWYINGNEYVPARDSLEWNKNFPTGSYEIKMVVLFEDESIETYEGVLKVGCEALFYANGINISLKDTVFCNKEVHFQADIENYKEIKWYVDGDECVVEDPLDWYKSFETGEYEIKMVTLFDNGETATLVATLKIEILWIKIRNVRY